MWRLVATGRSQGCEKPQRSSRRRQALRHQRQQQEEYAQNNWMLVSLPVELYNQVNEKSTITSITGTLDEKLNVAMTATNVVAGKTADNIMVTTHTDGTTTAKKFLH